jgi:hypothetical protein
VVISLACSYLKVTKNEGETTSLNLLLLWAKGFILRVFLLKFALAAAIIVSRFLGMQFG